MEELASTIKQNAEVEAARAVENERGFALVVA